MRIAKAVASIYDIGEENFHNMLVSVVRNIPWGPCQLDELYLDNQDHHGLIFWYEDVKAVNKEIKDKTKT